MKKKGKSHNNPGHSRGHTRGQSGGDFGVCCGGQFPDQFVDHFSGPDFQFEDRAIALHGPLVAGVDEAGRGPWAGPVVAAAVILNESAIPAGLNDSKKLTEARRAALFREIMASSFVGVGIVGPQEIDRDNILKATFRAMAAAVAALPEPPASLLIDGNLLPPIGLPAEAVVKGDGRSLSIAAASIIAKVTRDRIMVELDQAFPAYCWRANKGYGTKAHRVALLEHGVSPHHRRSFKPIQALLA